MDLKILQNLNFKSGSKYYLDNLLKSYRELIRVNIFGKEEIYFLKAWIKDIKNLSN